MKGSDCFLIVPFKGTEKTSFVGPLKEYIVTTYSEDPEKYLADLRELDSLRTAIMYPEPHEECVSNYLKYFGQLQYLSAKFSIDEDNIKIVFTWSNALGKDKHSTSSYNVGFEKASVLFNLASLYNQLAGFQDIAKEDGLKKAAVYFQQAAGTFAFLGESLAGWGIGTGANSQIVALKELMLGHAQELFFSKAVTGKMKEATLAKLATQAANFYTTAYNVGQESTVFDKPWTSYMFSKQHYFLSQAEFYKSIEIGAAGKYGEQIARLLASQREIKLVLDNPHFKYLGQKLQEDVRSFGVTVNTALAKANKDNDVIYMETIPKPETLEPISGAKMANVTPFPSINELANLVGKPLFQELVPFSVHQAASTYSSKKTSLVKEWTDRLTEHSAVAHTSLASLNLPGAVDALEQPIGLPASLLTRSEEVRRSGGAAYIHDSWVTVSELARKNNETLKKAIDRLDEEEQEDKALKVQFGGRWTRTPSATLTKNMRETGAQYRSKMRAADDSNGLVGKKITANMHLIQAMSMSKEELESSIPASTASSTLALKDPNLKQLKSLLDNLNVNLSRRHELIKKLKAISDTDDIGPRLLTAAATKDGYDETLLFKDQLKIYEPVTNEMDTLLKSQDATLEAIVAANTKFTESRQTNDLIRQRESALNTLETGYKYFKELSGNLEEGIKFYNDLEEVLLRFYNSCNDFVVARQMDKKDVLSQIQDDISKMSLSPTPQVPVVQPLANPSFVAPGVWNPQQPAQYQAQNQYSNPNPGYPQQQGFPSQGYPPQNQGYSQYPPNYGNAPQNQGQYPPQNPGQYPPQNQGQYPPQGQGQYAPQNQGQPIPGQYPPGQGQPSGNPYGANAPSFPPNGPSGF